MRMRLSTCRLGKFETSYGENFQSFIMKHEAVFYFRLKFPLKCVVLNRKAFLDSCSRGNRGIKFPQRSIEGREQVIDREVPRIEGLRNRDSTAHSILIFTGEDLLNMTVTIN